MSDEPSYGTTPYGGSAPEAEDFEPYIGNWTPFIGSQIRRLDVIEFDVLDDFGVITTLIRAIFPAGNIEDVFNDDSGFSAAYTRGSCRKKIGDGWHYVLRRLTGWPSFEVRIDVTATDARVIPDSALLYDGDEQPLVFDDDSQPLILG